MRNSIRADMEITVDWRDEENNPLDERFVFVRNAVYTAQITLTAREGYAFAPISFKYEPENTVLRQPDDNINTKTRALTRVTYRKTVDPQNIGDEDLDLTSRIPAPVGGARPVTSFYIGSYGGTIAWETASAAAAGEVFQAGTVYRANVTLYAAPGYTLVGRLFTYSGGTLNASNEWDNKGSTITGMRIVFPPASGASAIPQSDMDLTYKIPRPVTGGTAVRYFPTPQYTGTVAWTPDEGVFQANTVYKAVVTLKTVSGRAFTFLEALSFTHSGKTYAGVLRADGSAAVTITFPATTDARVAVVTDMDLTDKVPKPVTNGAPTVSFSSAQYTGYVAWTDTLTGAGVSGLFAAETSYTARVNLIPISGYTMDGVGVEDNDFTYNPTWTDSVSYDPVSSAAMIVFKATGADTGIMPVSDRDLTSMPGAPVTNGAPETAFTADQYDGAVTWTVTNGSSHSGAFAAWTAYTARVMLMAKEGYTFDGIGTGAFTYDGALSVSNTAGSGSIIVVTIAFPATGADTGIMQVSDRNLTSRLGVPVMSGTPDTAFTADQYDGAVTWTVTDGSSHSGAFAAGTAYTARVTLTPKGVWSFTGIGSGTFTCDGALSVRNAAGSGGTMVVTIAFPETEGDTGLVPVSDRDLTSRPGAPETNGTPETAFTADQYDGAVIWTVTGGPVHSGTFAAGTAYTARITLTPKEGYTFAGIGGGGSAFTCDGALSVSNAAGSGGTMVVTIAFPETDITVPYSGFFSGSLDSTDSAIDLIREAKGTPRLNLALSMGDETTGLVGDGDLGMTGLVLDSTSSPAELTIDGQGRAIRMAGNSFNGSFITVSSGVTLTLRNITFAGRGSNNAPLVVVQNGGTLVLETGAVIMGNTNSGGSGGGVFVAAGGSLVINGGTISGNKAAAGGGLYVTGAGASIRMTGGTISGNSTTGSGGGVFIDGGRLFEMSGNAVISGNTATDSTGGGVYAAPGSSLVMTGSAAINGNEARAGGGVYVDAGGSLVMADSTGVSGNKAQICGGGVYIDKNGSFKMPGGTIYGKSAGVQLANTTGGIGAAIFDDRSVSQIGITDYTVEKGWWKTE
jgi:hypothetical protein